MNERSLVMENKKLCWMCYDLDGNGNRVANSEAYFYTIFEASAEQDKRLKEKKYGLKGHYACALIAPYEENV